MIIVIDVMTIYTAVVKVHLVGLCLPKTILHLEFSVPVVLAVTLAIRSINKRKQHKEG